METHLILNFPLPARCALGKRNPPPSLKSLVLAILRIHWVAFPHSQTYDIIPTPGDSRLDVCGFAVASSEGGMLVAAVDF